MPHSAATDINQNLFHVHAIGSRGLDNSFEMGRAFVDGVMFHNYEPDAEANAQTDNYFSEKGLLGRTHAVAMLDRDGGTELNLNYDPYTSSVFPPNPMYRDFYFPYPPPAGDYTFGVGATPYRRLSVPTMRLDQLGADTGLPVDWIVMDTQGAEFEILLGAARCCATTLVGFSAEVEFHPLYEGQKLFGDIAALAARHGFHLARLTPHPSGSFLRAPLGWRGNGMMVAADALFLKTVDATRDGHPDPWLGLRKLAFASLCHGNVEHALDALDKAAQLPPRPVNAPVWQRFLDQVLEVYRKTPPLFPMSFTDIYSLEDSLARFAPDRRDQNEDPVRTARRFFTHTDQAWFERLLPTQLSARQTPFERLLTEHGLDAVAGMVRRNRQTGAFNSCRALGWFAEPCAPLAEVGRMVGEQLAAAGPVCFYGSGEMFTIADALLALPDDRIGGIFDGDPARHGACVRGQSVRPASATAELPTCAHVVLCTRGSESSMYRTLIDSGFRGRVLTFNDLLATIGDESLNGQDKA